MSPPGTCLTHTSRNRARYFHGKPLLNASPFRVLPRTRVSYTVPNIACFRFAVPVEFLFFLSFYTFFNFTVPLVPSKFLASNTFRLFQSNATLNKVILIPVVSSEDHLYGLVVSVPGYRSRGLGFDSRRYQIF
jgi:hypothetical protein